MRSGTVLCFEVKWSKESSKLQIRRSRGTTLKVTLKMMTASCTFIVMIQIIRWISSKSYSEVRWIVLTLLLSARGLESLEGKLPGKMIPAQWAVQSLDQPPCLILSGNFSFIFVHEHQNENPEFMDEEMRRLHFRWISPSIYSLMKFAVWEISRTNILVKKYYR